MSQDDNSLLIVLLGVGLGAYFLLRQQPVEASEYADYQPNEDETDYSSYLLSAPEEPMIATQTVDTSVPMNPASVYSTSRAGQNNIQAWEGWRRNAYQDIAGNWSIGVGHKIVPGDGLTPSSILTDGQVSSLFLTDLSGAEGAVKSYVTAPITQGMFDALVDFVFNLGAGNLSSSTLLRLLNQRDYQGAANEFQRWVHSGASVVPQLVQRRNADAALFVS